MRNSLSMFEKFQKHFNRLGSLGREASKHLPCSLETHPSIELYPTAKLFFEKHLKISTPTIVYTRISCTLAFFKENQSNTRKMVSDFFTRRSRFLSIEGDDLLVHG